MIDPKELRIGNWIWSEVSEMELKVEANYFEMLEFDLKQKNSFYSPIPLTPEWLERLGFEYDERMIWWVNKKAGLFNAIRTTDNKDFIVAGSYGHSKPIRSVHELQNLFFALTGEEL